MCGCRREYMEFLIKLGYEKQEAARIFDSYDAAGDLDGLYSFIIANECLETVG